MPPPAAQVGHNLWLAGRNVKQWLKKRVRSGRPAAKEVIKEDQPSPVMPARKQLLLGLYYHATYPVRHVGLLAGDAERPPAGDRARLPPGGRRSGESVDDFPRVVPAANARLQERFDFISLHDAQSRVRRGYNPQPCVSITFDDGYADNCQQAIPWLVKHRIPCTYFVTVQNVLSGEPFSHDLVMGHRFAPNTPEQLRAMAAAGIEIGSARLYPRRPGPDQRPAPVAL